MTIFGYICVISKVHAVEPFDLPDLGAAFWLEAMAVAQVINRLYQPVKLNYDIHGNTLPHLHMHLFPRQPDDGFVGRPVDLKDLRHRYSDHDLAKLRSALRPHRPNSLRRLRHCGPAGSPEVPNGPTFPAMMWNGLSTSRAKVRLTVFWTATHQRCGA